MIVHWQSILRIASLSGILLLTAGYLYEKFAERQDKKRNPAPGRMVSLGDRSLHLLCKGNVGPTVVIEQGAGEPSRLWWTVQDQIAGFASVCTYDRSGYGWSDPVRAGRTITDRADDLHTLLTNAGIAGPYIFVAHSYGGLIVRSFARIHPDQTAGLVLVDTAEEGTLFQAEVLTFYSRLRLMSKVIEYAAGFGVLRLLSRWVPLDRFGFPFVSPGEYAAGADDLDSLQRAASAGVRLADPGAFGDMPVAVLTHGQTFPGPFAILEKGWSEGQARLAALSTNSQLLIAKNSNHMIQQDEPGLVVDTIRRVHVAVRNQAQLAEIPPIP